MCGANLYPPGVWFADAMAFFSGLTFVLFCFVFVFMLSLKPRPFVQSSFDMQASPDDSHTCFFSLFFSFFVYLEMSLFPSIFFCTISAFSLYGEYVVRSFLPDGVFSTL